MFSYFIPILILFILVYSIIKRVKVYDVFTEGVKKALPFAINIFPYIVSIFVLTNIFEASGISKYLCNLLSPIFSLLGIPSEVISLVLIKPFSGSGSLALVSEIYNTYGIDSYISRCASAIYGSSETVFYIATIYFAESTKKHKLIKPIIISLIASLFSTVVACLICKII